MISAYLTFGFGFCIEIIMYEDLAGNLMRSVESSNGFLKIV
jgi:hypothetical protein